MCNKPLSTWVRKSRIAIFIHSTTGRNDTNTTIFIKIVTVVSQSYWIVMFIIDRSKCYSVECAFLWDKIKLRLAFAPYYSMPMAILPMPCFGLRPRFLFDWVPWAMIKTYALELVKRAVCIVIDLNYCGLKATSIMRQFAAGAIPLW